MNTFTYYERTQETLQGRESYLPFLQEPWRLSLVRGEQDVPVHQGKRENRQDAPGIQNHFLDWIRLPGR